MSKQTTICKICGLAYPLPTKERKLLDPSGDFVCSQSCVLRWIGKHGDSKRLAFKHVVGHLRPYMELPDNCYSLILGMAFRSRYEMVVAELLYSSGLFFEYEKHGFEVGNGLYVPDFTIRRENVIIEVKGLWKINGKKKVKQFREQYPDYPLLVVTWPIRKSFTLGLPVIGGENA